MVALALNLVHVLQLALDNGKAAAKVARAGGEAGDLNVDYLFFLYEGEVSMMHRSKRVTLNIEENGTRRVKM